MVSFPPQSWCLLVRTDFTDDGAWAQVVGEATRPSPEGFEANVRAFSDPAADGAAWESLRDAAMATPEDEYASVLFVVDSSTLRSPDHPILVVSTSRFHRDTYPDGITAADRDGDGIADAADDCPDVFNPVRSMDGNVQSDVDGDGFGDACDARPLDASAH